VLLGNIDLIAVGIFSIHPSTPEKL